MDVAGTGGGGGSSGPAASGSPSDVNLRQVPTDELRWELSRRADARDKRVLLYFSPDDLRAELSRRGDRRFRRSDERRVALLFLGAITLALIAVLAGMSIGDKTLPDALVGLTGTSLGAIAGILVGKPTPEPHAADDHDDEE